MSAWEFIGWMIAVPMALFSLIFVYAVSVAVVRATAIRAKKNSSAKKHLRVVE